MHVDKVNQLKDRQRAQLTEVAHSLSLSVSVIEQMAKKLELEVAPIECAYDGRSGRKAGGLNISEVETAQELRSAFAGCKKGGGSRGVEAALMKSRGAAEGGRSSSTAASSLSHLATNGRRSSSESAKESCISGLSAMRDTFSGKASATQRLVSSKDETGKMVLGGKRHMPSALKHSTKVAPEGQATFLDFKGQGKVE